MFNQVKSQELIAVFSNKIEKVAVKVIVHTLNAVISGEIHVRPRLRLIDELISGEEYLAMTNAEVYDKSSNTHLRTKFLVINRTQIVMLIPWEDVDRKSE